MNCPECGKKRCLNYVEHLERLFIVGIDDGDADGGGFTDRGVEFKFVEDIPHEKTENYIWCNECNTQWAYESFMNEIHGGIKVESDG